MVVEIGGSTVVVVVSTGGAVDVSATTVVDVSTVAVDSVIVTVVVGSGSDVGGGVVAAAVDVARADVEVVAARSKTWVEVAASNGADFSLRSTVKNTAMMAPSSNRAIPLTGPRAFWILSRKSFTPAHCPARASCDHYWPCKCSWCSECRRA